MRIVCWFSCGAASAVATKKTIEKYGKDNVIVACCVVENEHIDNERFLKDCEKWFGLSVLRLRSDKFKDCWEVWEKTRYLVGVRGARCTTEMKKMVRQKFQRLSDIQIFGFTADENHRVERFKTQNPEVNLEVPLIDHALTKDNCFRIVQDAGIELPITYRLGYKNANCIGCVKGGAKYWSAIRQDFPDVFIRMAKLERELGRTILKLKGKRTYLDELPDDYKASRSQLKMECGIWCKGN